MFASTQLVGRIWNEANESARLDKKCTKSWHDKQILRREFVSSQQVLLFNSRLKLFPRKLRLRWSFKIKQGFPFSAIELLGDDGCTFCVNGQRLKHHFGGEEQNVENIRLQIQFEERKAKSS